MKVINNDYIECDCGGVLTEKDVVFSNGCNEKGEDYHEGTIICDKCGKHHEFSDWGECKSDEEFFRNTIDILNTYEALRNNNRG